MDNNDLIARDLALRLTAEVLMRRRPLDQALDDLAIPDDLPPRDRAFLRMLATTAIRHCGYLDTLILRASADKALPSPDDLLNVLRLGAAQLVFMDVPDYAAVDTAIRLAAKHNLKRQGGFINAVLRRIARERGDGPPDTVMADIPAWLMQAWTTDYGAETAHAIGAASLREAPLDISVRDPGRLQDWAAWLDAEILPGGTLRRAAGGRIEDLPGFDEGAWWVQDAAAAWPARLFGPGLENMAGRTVIDLCAAPGGKTAQLAAAGAHVVALDRSGRRLDRLRENMDRLRLTDRVTPVVADASQWMPDAPADFILLDAPCTATGTIRRNPDVMHLKTPDDMAKLCALQARLLDRAAMMLAPGGTLIYCTCSLQKDEGERQVEAFLSRNDSCTRAPVKASEIGGAETVTLEGDFRLLPQDGSDGFYIARLCRKPLDA